MAAAVAVVAAAVVAGRAAEFGLVHSGRVMPRLSGLKITFRCLTDVEMDLTSPEDDEPSPFVALVGANGAGKTTVLDAIAGAAFRAGKGRQLHDSNVSRCPIVLRFGSFYLGALFRGPGLGAWETYSDRPSLEWWNELRKALYVPSGYLPRMPKGVPLAIGSERGMDLEDALLLPQSKRRVGAVQQWWLHQHWEYPRTTTLDRLWQALEPFLGDRVYAGVNPEDHLPQFDAAGTKVSFNDLSSGERRIVLLFMEIAMQCGDDGLLLFDEPEAHFHPNWQRLLPDALQRLLPHGQVIVATHSPYIVDGLPAHQLFVMGEVPWYTLSHDHGSGSR